MARRAEGAGMSAAVAAYEVKAFNTAAASDNKIHDDAVARRFGFRGGLVPGVEVYAYMTHMPVARWGRSWLEHGEAECRFWRPVYDGALARVTAKEDGDAVELTVESAEERCATGRALMPAGRPPPAIEGLASAEPPAAERPPASERSLAPGRALGIRPTTIDRATLSTYLDEIRERDPIYQGEGLVHPGQILRLANQALVQNVVLGPWIHVGSKVRNHAAARIGEELTLRSKIASNTESKGHAIVAFDAVVLADGKTIIAEITHTAIWRPRQVPETSNAQVSSNGRSA
jgi:acyl dehydratase